ncbi:MAG: TetR/AcrR family transcriptional regulator [Sphingomonadaceae bacterium]|nr:TetR/AcrR family transcriptional regulator [Sphingomonadaceae bacterium]
MTDNDARKSKSRRTREAIFIAARRRFAAHGYDGASVRDIAADAGIDPALVIRYFGSKDALFAEASDFKLDLPPLDSKMRGRAGEYMVQNFLDIWEGPDAGGAFTVLLRSAASNEAAAAKLREVFATQVIPSVAALAGTEGAQQRAGLITSHMLGLAMSRYILKLPPVVSMPPEMIVTHVGRAIQIYLDTPSDRL